MKTEPGKTEPGRPDAAEGDEGLAEERSFHGLAVSPGIAIGPAHVSDHFDQAVPEYEIGPEQVDDERARFAEALAVSVKQLRKLKTKAQNLPDAAAEEMGYLLDAHLSMLSNSRLVRGVERRIASDRHNAEWAVQAEIAGIGESFSAMRDAYLAARFDDIRIVGMRLIRNLTKKPFEALSRLPDGTVILAEELTPADTALMDPRRVAGFATVLGGAESHTSIMARALGLPAVVGVAGLLTPAGRRESVIVDGSAGIVVVNPGAAPARQAAPPPGGDARRRRDRAPGQSGAAARARPGDRGRRHRPRAGAQRVPLHEPRHGARRGRAIRRLP